MDWKSIPFRILIVWQKGISLHNFMGIDFLMRIEFGSSMGKYLVRLFDEKNSSRNFFSLKLHNYLR